MTATRRAGGHMAPGRAARRIVPLLGLSACLSASLGLAQEPVRLRFGTHPTFQRMVIDWPKPVGYLVEHSDRAATFVFDAPAAFRDEQIAAGLGQAANGTSTATHGQESRITLHLPEGIELRHFRADAKVVIDLMHGGRVPAKEPAVPGTSAGTRPWEKPPLPRAASAPHAAWATAAKALAPAPAAPSKVVEKPARADLAPPARTGVSSAPATPSATAAAVRPAAPAPLPAAEPAPAPDIPVPPWRKTVRDAACRGDLERAAAILAERIAEAPLDPIDWYNLTWLLRTLAGATMAPPPLPADSPIYEASLVGLCSGRPVSGTVASWQRLAHAGQFTEFLIDVAPTATPRDRR